MKKNSSAVQAIMWLMIVSLAVVFVALVTNGILGELNKRQRIIDDLVWLLDMGDRRQGEYLSQILHCGNGRGMIVQFNQNTQVEVDCSIKNEWVNGKFYPGDSYRTKRGKK